MSDTLLAELSEEDPAENSAAGSDSRSRRWIALAVALVSLLVGLVAYAAADAGSRQSAAEREAQQASMTSFAESSKASAAFYDDFGAYVNATTLRRERDIAALEGELLGRADRAARAAAWETATTNIADTSLALIPGERLDNPYALWNEVFQPVDVAALRHAALRETSESWRDKSDLYTAVATVLAVALALVGLSLTVAVRVRGYLLWPAGVLVTASLVWGGSVAIRPTAHTPPEAINAVAEGYKLFREADYTGAIESFTRAIEIKPDYAAAYSVRAAAQVFAESPEALTGAAGYAASSSTPAAWRSALADLERALDLGADDVSSIANLSEAYVHVGDYARAERFARDAIAINDKLPLSWLYLMLALAAQGAGEADSAADSLIDRIVARPYSYERGELFADARGSLENIAIAVPERKDLAERLQMRLVEAQLEDEAPTGSDPEGASITDLDLSFTGSFLVIDATWRNIPEGSRVAWIVYYRPDETVDWAETTAVSPIEQVEDLPDDIHKRYHMPGCLGEGEFRVVVYANNRVIGSAEATQPARSGELVEYTDILTGMRTCVPESWTVDTSVSGRIVATAPDGERSMRYWQLPLAAPPLTEEETTALIEEVLDRLTADLPETAEVSSNENVEYGNSNLVGTERWADLDDGLTTYVWVSVFRNTLHVAAERFTTTFDAEAYDIATSTDLPW